MYSLALFARLEAKSGQEAAVAQFEVLGANSPDDTNFRVAVHSRFAIVKQNL